MIKKLLFISFLFLSIAVFSQKTLQKLTAAPNPFATKTNIKFTSTKNQIVFFVVKNMIGKSVYIKKHSVKKGKNQLPFYRNNLQAGMYIYTIQSQKETISKRFVIQ